MRRRLFALASALSFLLCLATFVLWVRSLTTLDWIGAARVEGPAGQVRVIIIESNRGLITVNLSREVYPVRSEFDKRVVRIPRPPVAHGSQPSRRWDLGPGPLNRLGFGRSSFAGTVRWGTSSTLLLDFPHAFILLLSAVMPTLWVWSRVSPARRQARRRALGLCPSCGYDLRASPERCPECGAVVTRTKE